MFPFFEMRHLQGAKPPLFSTGCVLHDNPGCICVLRPWCTCSYEKSITPVVYEGLSLGVANHLKAVQIDEDRYAYPPTQESQNLEGKLKHYPPQVPDSYKPERLRVLRFHGLKSNTSKIKHNWEK